MTGRLGPRDRAAVLLGSLAGQAARRLGRGGGTALPGLVATTVAPGVTARLARLPAAGSVVVTGTNGKTTTTHLLAGIAREAGYDPVANHSGSNLERGVVSAYLDALAGDRDGRAARRLGVLEVDEAALPGLLPVLRPRAALFLNLFRDQLDRYGEVDSVVEGWREMLVADASGLTLVLNADDPPIAQLADTARGDVVDALAEGGEAGTVARQLGGCVGRDAPRVAIQLQIRLQQQQDHDLQVVVEEVGRQVETAARPQQAHQVLYHRLAQQPAAPVAPLRPRVRKVDVHGAQR